MIKIPKATLVTICEKQRYELSIDPILTPMRGDKRRAWFNKHAYHCLPLLIGNQMGFGIRSLKEFTAIWNGKGTPKDTAVDIIEAGDCPDYQAISSHFGMGVVTVQNRFTFRTPRLVNLMTINPPNYWIDGIHHMTGVVETDNLRRDFTFNLKLTRPNYKVHVKKGDLVGCVIPVPRYFIDAFALKKGEELFSESDIEQERTAMRDFGRERATADKQKPQANGRRYFRGEDVYGIRFADHQKRIKGKK